MTIWDEYDGGGFVGMSQFPFYILVKTTAE